MLVVRRLPFVKLVFEGQVIVAVTVAIIGLMSCLEYPQRAATGAL